MTDTDNLELKKRSRRRLVGAAALALLAAILLPMVMDQEPRRAAQDIQVTIPDRDADTTLSRPIGSRNETAAEAELPPPPEEEPSEPVRAPKAPPAEAAPAAPPPAANNPPQATAPQPTNAPRAPAAKPAVGQDEAARVQALLGGQTEAITSPARDEVLVVQVGAFSEAATAAALAAELKGKGFSAYTEKAGAVTRVRVGPFAARADAEKAAERLRAAGRKAVVTPR